MNGCVGTEHTMRLEQLRNETNEPCGHGGRREGAGRPAGVPNKATREQGARLSELAKSYTDIAFSTLVDVAMNGSSDTARIAAANSILDRGYGKPKADLGEVVDLPAIVIQRAE